MDLKLSALGFLIINLIAREINFCVLRGLVGLNCILNQVYNFHIHQAI